MAFNRRREDKTGPAPKDVSPGDTLARIESVTDRLEWLAEQIEKQLRERDARNGK